jgi:hypothetical protein
MIRKLSVRRAIRTLQVVMNRTMNTICLYVRLLNEGTEVFRPTQAFEVGGGLFRLIAAPDYNPEDEEWELLPGETVRVAVHHGANGDFPVAVKA